MWKIYGCIQTENRDLLCKSSIIRQKGESQNRCYKNTKHAKFPKNKHFLLLDTQTCVCLLEGKKYSVFGKFGVLCCLVFEIRPFPLLPMTFPYSIQVRENKDQKKLRILTIFMQCNGFTDTKLLTSFYKIKFSVVCWSFVFE